MEAGLTRRGIPCCHPTNVKDESLQTTAFMSFSRLGHAYSPESWVFRGYAASVERGQIMAILGPNGRGKTTLLKLLLGAMRPTEGHLQVNGRCAFVPQIFQTTFDFRCFDMVLMGRARRVGLLSHPKWQDEAAAFAAMERVGVAHLAERSFHELSGGQRQPVIFARAIAAEADILILDEPTSALDLENQAQVLRLIHQLSRQDGLTILMTTHHPHHAHAVADRALLMFGSEAFETGPAREILTASTLSRLYGTPMAEVDFTYHGQSIQTLVPVLAMQASEQMPSAPQTQPLSHFHHRQMPERSIA